MEKDFVSDRLGRTVLCGARSGGGTGGVFRRGTVAIIGSGPVGLAALITAQFYAPDEIIIVGMDDNRLEVSRELGATQTINNSDGNAIETIMALT